MANGPAPRERAVRSVRTAHRPPGGVVARRAVRDAVTNHVELELDVLRPRPELARSEIVERELEARVDLVLREEDAMRLVVAHADRVGVDAGAVLGSGPVAGWLTASTICSVAGGNVPDDPDDPDGDPDTELVAVPPPDGEPE